MKVQVSGSMGSSRINIGQSQRHLNFKKDELYVIQGEVLIHAFHYLNSQKASALVWLNRIRPELIDEIEKYLEIYKQINLVMARIKLAMPLMDILPDAQIEKERRARVPGNGAATKAELQELNELLSGFEIEQGSDIDETHTPESGSLN